MLSIGTGRGPVSGIFSDLESLKNPHDATALRRSSSDPESQRIVVDDVVGGEQIRITASMSADRGWGRDRNNGFG